MKKTRPAGWPLTQIEKNLLEGGSVLGGRSPYHNYVKGREIGRTEAMRAKCYDCMNGFADGKQDCKVISCPLYPWQPFREE
ncbi:MAG: hypothetical protein KGY78_10860 [Anaerolineae bacterium]|nr:hypothetical protein [Anaerolineae bacterium]